MFSNLLRVKAGWHIISLLWITLTNLRQQPLYKSYKQFHVTFLRVNMVIKLNLNKTLRCENVRKNKYAFS